ncbi:hypothetical protein STXM2123_6009 [Streptomyces sp. F-3]|uniref:erythromycin esterase family protein n=1 Tax=Streptomyces TaxID=1883 RepID=UPI0007C2E330|nr:hypothetical protein STXM2123_6009 [Streptomyces sp. F-3]
MVDTIDELLTNPSAGVVLRAHNGHIATDRHGRVVSTLGQHLRTRRGNAHYATRPAVRQ